MTRNFVESIVHVDLTALPTIAVTAEDEVRWARIVQLMPAYHDDRELVVEIIRAPISPEKERRLLDQLLEMLDPRGRSGAP